MSHSHIHTNPHGFTVVASNRDFPSLAALDFLDLKPVGRAARVQAALDAVPPITEADGFDGSGRIGDRS
jgi:hypothetical protein